MRSQFAEQIKSYEVSSSFPDEDITLGSCSEREKRPLDQCSVPSEPPVNPCPSTSLESEFPILRGDKCSTVSSLEIAFKTSIKSQSDYVRTIPCNETKKKAKKSQGSQLTLKSFFQKSSIHSNVVDNGTGSSTNQADVVEPSHHSNEPPVKENEGGSQQYELNSSTSTQEQDEPNACSQEKNNVALFEWQRIQKVMQNSIPLCKGHKEPCVARIVKKQGPNFGRRFYVCVRAEVSILLISQLYGILLHIMEF